MLGKREKSPLPTDAEFIRLALQWADEYNATPLDSLDGRTPDQVFAEQCPQAACAPADKRLLDQLFWQREERTILNGGCVEIDRLRYEPTPETFGALTNAMGRRVRILRDPYNIGEAIALDLATGEFIGELRVQELIQQNVGDRLTQDHIRAAMRKERAFKRSHADYLLAIQSIADACGFKTEREYLAERAGMKRTGTDNIPVAVSAAAPGAGASAPHTARTPRRLAASPFVSDSIDELISAGKDNS
jgi:Mu transposase, C-terminal